MSIVAVDVVGDSKVSGPIQTDNAKVAKESVIALAIASTLAKYVISDFKAAVHKFTRGHISPEAQRILVNFRDQQAVQIIWVPAHSFLPGNKAAHATAR